MKRSIASVLLVFGVLAFGAGEPGGVCLSSKLELFQNEFKSDTADREEMRQAAAELLYISEAQPKAIALTVAEKVRGLDTAKLDKLLAKYTPELASEALSPLVREYVQNLYFAIATRRDIPPSVIQEKVGYGSEQQRAYRSALTDRLRRP